jgi:hypothetical protein
VKNISICSLMGLLVVGCGGRSDTASNMPALHQTPAMVEYQYFSTDGAETYTSAEWHDGRRSRVELSIGEPTVHVTDLVEGRKYSWSARAPEATLVAEPVRRASAATKFWWQGDRRAIPSGRCRVSGEVGTLWHRHAEGFELSRTACITDDGVLLLRTAAGRKRMEALRVVRGPINEHLFLPPTSSGSQPSTHGVTPFRPAEAAGVVSPDPTVAEP